MSNIKIGSTTEKKVIDIFRQERYWVYNTPLKTNGQPVDIIAMRKNKNWLVDAKHVEKQKASFSFERVEPNQITTFIYAKEFAEIKNLGFAIEFERDDNIYWLSFETFLKMSENGQKSVNMSELRKFVEVLNDENNTF